MPAGKCPATGTGSPEPHGRRGISSDLHETPAPILLVGCHGQALRDVPPIRMRMPALKPPAFAAGRRGGRSGGMVVERRMRPASVAHKARMTWAVLHAVCGFWSASA
jgi:hypothetical protein